MKYLIAIFVFVTLISISCSSKVHNQIKSADVEIGKNFFNWTGTYKGTLPCKDCNGIETIIRLNNDTTYQITLKHLSRKPDSTESYGIFVWNKENNTITLNEIKNMSNKFFVKENTIIQLDSDGNQILGEFAYKYVLKKIQSTPIEKITDITWRLIEIQGKPISRLDKHKKPIQFRLISKENRVNGFAGCNNFWGSFNLKDGNRISFSKMASTLMACPDLHLETEFYRILDRADNYTIKDNFLFLNKAKMAPLAKFEAVVE
ncbi:MAG: copper resistance protein NlpE N-terminal domain-containing protein [Ignavibacterium sp.]|nr:copper resistance protein NlpE N-terminal domain-containing protein [Ignavibacterium sp.]MDW8375269.1 copper resistance protein NlpE N-terminal domain-containing protein [Ignavibacteriales bacterium]